MKTFYHIIPADIYSNLVDIKFEVKRILQKHSIKEVTVLSCRLVMEQRSLK